MRAMVLESQAPIGAQALRLETLPKPEPAAGEILVRIAACGLCRTDLHIVEGELPLARTPIVPGHQAVGRVDGMGPGVTHLRPGDRVGIAWLRRTCGACRHCESGRENLCERAEFTGYHADGGFAEYAVGPAGFAYLLPAVFSDTEAAPLLCAGIIGYRALTLTDVGRGGRLGLYGFGSSAHITLQVAVARDIRVYVVTRSVAARALARDLGAAWSGDVTERPPTPTEGAIIFAPAGEIVPLAARNRAPGRALARAGVGPGRGLERRCGRAGADADRGRHHLRPGGRDRPPGAAQPGARGDAGAGGNLHVPDPAPQLRGPLRRAPHHERGQQHAGRRPPAAGRGGRDPGAPGHHAIPAGPRQPGAGAALARRVHRVRGAGDPPCLNSGNVRRHSGS